MEELWRPLRISGSSLIDKGARYQEVRKFLSKKQRVSVTLEAKKAVRDDIYDGYLSVDRSEAKNFALSHLDELSYITDEELEWCLDWREVLVNAATDIPESPDGKPRIQEFEIQDVDWLLWIIIGERKIDLPESLTYSAVLEGLQWARRETAKKNKLAAIREYLATNNDYEEAFLNMEYPLSFKDHDPSKFSLSECRMYWLQHNYIPRMKSKAATQTIENFTKAIGRPPNWGEDLREYVPPDHREWGEVILSLAQQRLKLKTFRDYAQKTSTPT